MTRKEMVELSEQMTKDSSKFYVKFLGWMFLGGLAIGKACENFALSSNHKMCSNILDEVVKHEDEM